MKKLLFCSLAVASFGFAQAQDPMTALAAVSQFGRGDIEFDASAFANKGIGITMFSDGQDRGSYRIGIRYARYGLSSAERDAYFDGANFKVSLRSLISSEIRFDLAKQNGGRLFASVEFGQRKFRVGGDGTVLGGGGGVGAPTGRATGGTGNSAWTEFSEYFIAPGVGYTFQPSGQSFAITALATYSMGLDTDRNRSVAGRAIEQKRNATWYSVRFSYKF